MNFYSTNRHADLVGFKSAVLQSLPSDNGLYFPEEIPQLSIHELNELKGQSLAKIGFKMMYPFVKEDLSENRLKDILEDVFSFETPLVKVNDHMLSLELYHGPTYAFKDVGARFLARCLGEFSAEEGRETTILVATSGDTGGAVAHGFLGIKGVRVVILYPSKKVSELQEKQLTTLGQNITALEVDGDFDQCQALVKKAFLDDELNQDLNLTSANSINIARWLPQAIYYAWMSLQRADAKQIPVAVPSGNYGNLTAGLLAKKMGFPLGHFIACSNANDVIPRYLMSAQFEPMDTIPTYANAMDVSRPSNFSRLLELYDHSYDKIASDISGFSMSNVDIIQTIHESYQNDSYLLDPHSAIAYAALKEMFDREQIGVFLATAHPVKFIPVMKKAINSMEIPDFAKDLMSKEKNATFMEGSYEAFRTFLTKS